MNSSQNQKIQSRHEHTHLGPAAEVLNLEGRETTMKENLIPRAPFVNQRVGTSLDFFTRTPGSCCSVWEVWFLSLSSLPDDEEEIIVGISRALSRGAAA